MGLLIIIVTVWLQEGSSGGAETDLKELRSTFPDAWTVSLGASRRVQRHMSARGSTLSPGRLSSAWKSCSRVAGLFSVLCMPT
jgi:hypothetical protein